MFIIMLTPLGKCFKRHFWSEGGTFTTAKAAEFQAKQIRKMKDRYAKVEVEFLLSQEEDDAYCKMMSIHMNFGETELIAEEKTIIAMKKMFPNLKRNLGNKYKISTGILQEF